MNQTRENEDLNRPGRIRNQHAVHQHRHVHDGIETNPAAATEAFPNQLKIRRGKTPQRVKKFAVTKGTTVGKGNVSWLANHHRKRGGTGPPWKTIVVLTALKEQQNDAKPIKGKISRSAIIEHGSKAIDYDALYVACQDLEIGGTENHRSRRTTATRVTFWRRKKCRRQRGLEWWRTAVVGGLSILG